VIVKYTGEKLDPNPAKHSMMLITSNLTQLILFTPFYLQDEAFIRKAMKYSNVVINLAGRESSRPSECKTRYRKLALCYNQLLINLKIAVSAIHSTNWFFKLLMF